LDWLDSASEACCACSPASLPALPLASSLASSLASLLAEAGRVDPSACDGGWLVGVGGGVWGDAQASIVARPAAAKSSGL
jgi:hypothetical protein